MTKLRKYQSLEKIELYGNAVVMSKDLEHQFKQLSESEKTTLMRMWSKQAEETKRTLACETIAKQYPEIHTAMVAWVGLEIAMLIWDDVLEQQQGECELEQKESMQDKIDKRRKISMIKSW